MATFPFVAQFPISTTTFVPTLQPHIGQNTNKDKFAPPTVATKANIKAFLVALHAYEMAPSDLGVTTLNNLMTSLELSGIRLQENNDAVIFIPRGTSTPVVCGGVLVWDFALLTEAPFIVCDPHSGQDGTIRSVTMQFLAGAKALLSHYFNPNVDDNPNFKGNPITPSNIKKFADPAHSNTTAFVPFVTGFLEVFPRAVGTVTHGMVGAPNFQLLANNDTTGHFISSGAVSFDALLAIAVALQPLPANPSIVTLEATVPGFIKNTAGVTVPLVSVNNKNAPIRQHKGITDNSDCVGHMLNGGKGAFDMPPQSDKAWFQELGPHFRQADSHVMPLFAAAQAMAIDWYGKYDASIQDPWTLNTKFPDVYNDMNLYPKLFDAAFVAAYKANGTNPYNTKPAQADIVETDLTLPADELDVIDDISDAGVVDPIGANDN